MGNQQNKQIKNPAELKFKRRHPVLLSAELSEMLQRIALLTQYPNTHLNPSFKWYQAIGIQFYLYGDIKDDKPNGECLFFSKKELFPDSPMIIATIVGEKSTYSEKTLLIFSDYSYYYGEIKQTEQGPTAEGSGLLVSKQLIYDGQFKNGFPHGYGFMKSKNSDLTGIFENGVPCGDCIEKSKKGLFIGELFLKIRKYGKIITPENKEEIVNEEYPQNGKTVVEL